jgi:hypothetical protein
MKVYVVRSNWSDENKEGEIETGTHLRGVMSTFEKAMDLITKKEIRQPEVLEIEIDDEDVWE